MRAYAHGNTMSSICKIYFKLTRAHQPFLLKQHIHVVTFDPCPWPLITFDLVPFDLWPFTHILSYVNRFLRYEMNFFYTTNSVMPLQSAWCCLSLNMCLVLACQMFGNHLPNSTTHLTSNDQADDNHLMSSPSADAGCGSFPPPRCLSTEVELEFFFS